jgi:hypothetical protein
VVRPCLLTRRQLEQAAAERARAEALADRSNAMTSIGRWYVTDLPAPLINPGGSRLAAAAEHRLAERGPRVDHVQAEADLVDEAAVAEHGEMVCDVPGRATEMERERAGMHRLVEGLEDLYAGPADEALEPAMALGRRR